MTFSKKRRRKNKYRPQQQELDAEAILKNNPEIAYVTPSDTWIKARTENQAKYIQTLKENDLVVCTGPAGTGKTYLAVAVALQMLKMGKISKIIITRPVVEAGEKMGYLPGTLEEKIDPYLRPIYDAFNSLMGPGRVQEMLNQEQVELAPLAYMRGRTLEYAFVILDEAQNATVEQMEMLLTRMGEGSKIVVNGDVTQVDLKKKEQSGLASLIEILDNLPKVCFFRFTEEDVVRHPLVKEIVKRYEKWKEKREANTTTRGK
jgi:phosphate starvation-inducible PhoH-like protein